MPYHFDSAVPEIRHGPPVLGEHTTEILAELGYTNDDIVELARSGAVEGPNSS